MPLLEGSPRPRAGSPTAAAPQQHPSDPGAACVACRHPARMVSSPPLTTPGGRYFPSDNIATSVGLALRTTVPDARLPLRAAPSRAQADMLASDVALESEK